MCAAQRTPVEKVYFSQKPNSTVVIPELFIAISLLAAILATIFWFAPRPRLNSDAPKSQVPANFSLESLPEWLHEHEQSHGSVIEGAEATIDWATKPEVTELCVLYVHGFSATRQEIAPIPEKVAAHFGANVVHTRLAGHGLSENPMAATAEDWLQSMVDAWEIASRIGKKVVIIAVSTGAPLSIWLNEQVIEKDRVHSFIFLSPNFRIRNPFGFLLTWPWAESWVPLVIGREHRWEPENEMAARYWTNRYETQAVIEMQKVVDWASKLKPDAEQAPMATLYMEDDPTINHTAAVAFHSRWPAGDKQLHRVTLDAQNPQHVFAGDITAPHRTDWCVDVCTRFIEGIR